MLGQNMETLTYRCTSCGQCKIIRSIKRKRQLKSKCLYCNRKTQFIAHHELLTVKPISNFCSSYTLAADLTIGCDYVHVEGIKVKGDVSINQSTGSSLKGMKILENKENKVAGNINLNESTVGSINNNVVAGDVNVTSSHVNSIDKNLIGFSFDNDEAVIAVINHMLGKKLPQDIEDKLKLLQKILWENPKIAETLGKKLNSENKNKKGVLGTTILKNLKQLGLDTVNKAKDKGLDALFKWFMVVIGIDG